MADPTSPLYIAPRWDPEFFRWMVDFARHCTEADVRASMEIMAPLGMEALRLFDAWIAAKRGLACDYRRGGYYDVCRSEAGLTDAVHEAEIVRGHGYHPEVLAAAGLREAEPALSEDVVGGVFYPEASTLDPHRLVTQLAAAAAASRGVEIRRGRRRPRAC